MQTQYCGIGRFRRTQANRAIVILIKWYIYLQNILYSRLHHSLFHTVSRSTLFRLLIHTHYSAFRLQIHTVVVRLTLAFYTLIPHALSLSLISPSLSLTHFHLGSNCTTCNQFEATYNRLKTNGTVGQSTFTYNSFKTNGKGQ